MLKLLISSFRAVAKSCRGNIKYHTLNTIVHSNVQRSNCTSNGPKNKFSSIKSTQATPVTARIETNSSSNQYYNQKEEKVTMKENVNNNVNCAKAALNYTLNFDYLSEIKSYQKRKKLEESEKVFKTIKRNQRVKTRHKRSENNQSLGSKKPFKSTLGKLVIKSLFL